tara:strand:- start:5827 stop:6582 length:756 start_codon:yes stop_codon:yes gene_type:complete
MKLTKSLLEQMIYEEIGSAEASRFDPGSVAEEKKCAAGEHRCTSGGACTKKACNHPVGAIASVDLKEEFEQIVREELEKIFDEGEVIDFKKRKMLDLQKKMMDEPEEIFTVDIEPWGKLQSKDLNVAIQFAKTSVTNGFELGPETHPKVLEVFELEEGNKASKTVGEPPYRERGATESQAQQKAAGMALSARRGDTPVSKLKGAALDLYHNEITTKELKNLAKLGQKVKQHKSKEPKHLKSLPGHATQAKD